MQGYTLNWRTRAATLFSGTVQTIERFNTLRTGDADLRFYITTVQDG